MSEKTKSRVYREFEKGLESLGLTMETLQSYSYCGGDRGCHANYFRICCKGLSQPPHKDHCVCGHVIAENCYLKNEANNFLVLGNCCIKRFVTKSGRTCEICGASHRNRVVNRCNECRKGYCDDCKVPCNPSYKRCWECHKKSQIEPRQCERCNKLHKNNNTYRCEDCVGICLKCDVKCKPQYRHCWRCYNNSNSRKEIIDFFKAHK